MVKHRKQKCVGWCGAGEVGLMDVVVVLLLENFWANNASEMQVKLSVFYAPVAKKRKNRD